MDKLIAYSLVIWVCLSSAQAASPTFSDRVAWASAAGGTPSFVEDFNEFGNQEVDFSHAPVIFQNSFSLFSTGLSGTSQRVEHDLSTTVDGSNHARIFVNADEPTTVRMAFVKPVTAWGFDVGKVEDCCELAVVDVFLDGQTGAADSFTLSDGFIGYVAPSTHAVTSLVFRSGSYVPGDQGQPFGVDNIAGFTVPEPSSSSIVFMGGVIVLGKRSRRRTAGADRDLRRSQYLLLGVVDRAFLRVFRVRQ